MPEGTQLSGMIFIIKLLDGHESQHTSPVIKLRSTAGTGYTYVTRKSRTNDPGRLVIRKYDPVAGRYVEFREER